MRYNVQCHICGSRNLTGFLQTKDAGLFYSCITCGHEHDRRSPDCFAPTAHGDMSELVQPRCSFCEAVMIVTEDDRKPTESELTDHPTLQIGKDYGLNVAGVVAKCRCPDCGNEGLAWESATLPGDSTATG